MNLFICLVGPSIIGIKLFEKINKKEINLKNLIIYFLLILFLVNFLSGIVSVWFLGASTSIDASLTQLPIYAIKYTLISMVFSIIVPIVIQVIRSNVAIKMEVKKNEK